jgi:hypothetical protein
LQFLKIKISYHNFNFTDVAYIIWCREMQYTLPAASLIIDPEKIADMIHISSQAFCGGKDFERRG